MCFTLQKKIEILDISFVHNFILRSLFLFLHSLMFMWFTLHEEVDILKHQRNMKYYLQCRELHQVPLELPHIKIQNKFWHFLSKKNCLIFYGISDFRGWTWKQKKLISKSLLWPLFTALIYNLSPTASLLRHISYGITLTPSRSVWANQFSSRFLAWRVFHKQISLLFLW